MTVPSSPSAFRLPPSAFRRGGFTLIELLVVIGIIAILAGILFPTIRKMRLSSQEADTRNLLNQIDQACQAYFLATSAYPGPLSDAQLVPAVAAPVNQPDIFFNDTSAPLAVTPSAVVNPGSPPNNLRVTSSENLVLGLMGGMELYRQPTATPPTVPYFEPTSVGQGPSSLNPLKVGRTDSYMQTNSLSGGRLLNVLEQPINDTVIPEFVDRFSGAGETDDADTAGVRNGKFRIGGMPILYFRSRRSGVSTLGPPAVQTLVATDPLVTNVDIHLQDNAPYLASSVGTGRDSNGTLEQKYKGVPFVAATPHGLVTALPDRTIDKNNQNPGVTYQYPYDAYDYFVDPASYDRTKSTALTAADYAGKRTRKKDSYVLISAGRDRIYGTEDDITNFGNVLP